MSEACQILHQRLSKLPKFSFSPQEKQKLHNGIYIVFEKDTPVHNTNRIVHIGTHYSNAGLSRRIKNHPSTHNNSSVLRRHIGQAILNKHNGYPLKRYESVDLDEITKEIGCYIKNKLEFFIMDFNGDKKKRCCMKYNLISTINACRHCKPSEKWDGRKHPDSRIRETGLWNIYGLKGWELSPEEAQALVIR